MPNWDIVKKWPGISAPVPTEISPKREAVPAPKFTITCGEIKSGRDSNVGSRVDNYGDGLPPEEYAGLAAELGITKAALESFVEIVEKK